MTPEQALAGRFDPAPAAINCGLVMPVSEMGEYSSGHWRDVHTILSDVATSAGFAPSLVSDANEVGVIHSRIVTNLYEWPMVICDVSGRNPNVMFELGMRLTFDKPVVIVMDDKTKVPFDINVIEYLTYPADLRFPTVVAFKEKLSSKLKATLETKKPVSFLKHFNIATAPSIQSQEVAPDTKLILDTLNEFLSQQKALGNKIEGLAIQSRMQEIKSDEVANQLATMQHAARLSAIRSEVTRKQ